MACHLLVLSILLSITLALINYSSSITFLLRNWRDIKSTKLQWRNKYLSHKELYALFDRGDIMFASILIATSLQLSHPDISKVLAAHSTYKTNAWRRIIRTAGFVHIMLRSDSSEQEQVIAWLNRLHKPIPLFLTETSVVVIATMAYGVVKTYEFLGDMTSHQKDATVTTVMSMADKLDLKDKHGRKMPSTMIELEEFLHTEVQFETDELLKRNSEFRNLLGIRGRNETMRAGVVRVLKTPLTSLSTVILKTFIHKLTDNVLAQGHRSQGIFGQPFWWCIRKIHRFLMAFHYSMCPHMLTFRGTLGLMGTANPGLETIFMELHQEIFGSKNDAVLTSLPGKDSQQVSDMTGETPRMRIDVVLSHTALSFHEETAELIKCSYYRGKLVPDVGHHIKHLGVIMDGNRRYASDRALGSAISGHRVGAFKLLDVISWTFSSGIQNLTVWALSNDNLKRGPLELNPLFSLMTDFARQVTAGYLFLIPGLRLRVVGDRSVMPEYLREAVAQAEAATAKYSNFNLQFAIGYGGRSEVIRATRLAVNAKMAQEGSTVEEAIGGLNEADISRQVFSAQLGLPQIGAILRTSGENRLSGFALWESQHAEFAIVQENWPALKQSTFLRSLFDLSKRDRRFGA